MPKIIFVSGACGSGKSTFADALARHLVRQNHKTVYVIHGDDFHSGFREPEEKGDFFVNGQASDQVLWEDILRFNWDCILRSPVLFKGRANYKAMPTVGMERLIPYRRYGAREAYRRHGAGLSVQGRLIRLGPGSS